MNIFYLHENLEKCARMHCDKHVVKMILEYAQILSFAHHYSNSEYKDKVYRMTHKNHPMMKWIVESRENYYFLYRLWRLLCQEYTKRYHKIHKTERNYRSILKHIPSLPHKIKSKLPQAMPKEYQGNNTINAYRRYYTLDKMKQEWCKWKHGIPEEIKEIL